jgi:hypothetical protein
MELSAPLIAGNTYSLSFYNRKDPAYDANLLEIGYSANSASFGTAIDTAAIPGTTWDFVFITFTPTVNSSYITVRSIAGSYGWNFVDDFVIADITNTPDATTADPAVRVFPNPTSGMISIAASSPGGIESVTVKDVQGNVLLFTQSTLIDLTGFPAGMYILEVATDQGRSVKRIVRE